MDIVLHKVVAVSADFLSNLTLARLLGYSIPLINHPYLLYFLLNLLMHDISHFHRIVVKYLLLQRLFQHVMLLVQWFLTVARVLWSLAHMRGNVRARVERLERLRRYVSLHRRYMLVINVWGCCHQTWLAQFSRLWLILSLAIIYQPRNILFFLFSILLLLTLFYWRVSRYFRQFRQLRFRWTQVCILKL